MRLVNQIFGRRTLSPLATFAPVTTDLRLRPLTVDDEAEFLAAHRELDAEKVSFGLGWRAKTAWSDYLAKLERTRQGIDLPEDRVPATFLVADVKRVIVGRTSIRHTLNEQLRHIGGHIGYAVLPDHRQRGYGTEILRQSLIVAHAIGIDRVMVTCDDDNPASAKIIESCGGTLESRTPPIRRYWID